ncbi:MAG: alpha/beta hydrolase [Candidatus Eiseniibacteriota bacterium]|nr:MAG: alpha/beta hydrolase [Candidatus Eisenbacteria bacterium]
MKGVKRGTVQAFDGVHISYEMEGEGPALVLIHGWSLNLKMWDDQVPAFSRRYQVVRYDRRGFGLSGGKEGSGHDVDDLSVLLSLLGIQRTHVLGMSQGALTALGFALAHPGSLSGLVLQGPQPPRDFGLRWNGADRYPLQEYRELARRKGLQAFRRAWLEHPLLSIPAHRPELKARLEVLLECYSGDSLLAPGPRSGEDALPSMGRIPEILAPALVVVGNQEIPYFRIAADALVYALPHASKAVIEGGGHLINLIEPEKYNELVMQFLADLD